MLARAIVDEHFTKNYKYYRQVCYRYYRGRYLFEDLLNETYLKFIEVKEDTIFALYEIDKLHCIGLRIIRSLFQKKGRRSNTKENGNLSSVLFETPGIDYEYDFMASDNESDEQEIQEYFEKATSAIEKGLRSKSDGQKERSVYLKVSTFLAVQQSNINQISKQTGISRPYITETYRQSQAYLQKEILK